MNRGLSVHERTLVNTHRREFWGSMRQLMGSMALIVGVLVAEQAVEG